MPLQLTPAQHAGHYFALIEFAEREAAVAEAAGDRHKADRYLALVRSMSTDVARYGLQRYANHPETLAVVAKRR